MQEDNAFKRGQVHFEDDLEILQQRRGRFREEHHYIKSFRDDNEYYTRDFHEYIQSMKQGCYRHE